MSRPHIDPNLYFEVIALYRKIALDMFIKIQNANALSHKRGIYTLSQQVKALSDAELINMVQPAILGESIDD